MLKKKTTTKDLEEGEITDVDGKWAALLEGIDDDINLLLDEKDMKIVEGEVEPVKRTYAANFFSADIEAGLYEDNLIKTLGVISLTRDFMFGCVPSYLWPMFFLVVQQERKAIVEEAENGFKKQGMTLQTMGEILGYSDECVSEFIDVFANCSLLNKAKKMKPKLDLEEASYSLKPLIKVIREPIDGEKNKPWGSFPFLTSEGRDIARAFIGHSAFD